MSKQLSLMQHWSLKEENEFGMTCFPEHSTQWGRVLDYPQSTTIKKKDKNLPEVWLGRYTGACSETYDTTNLALDEKHVREFLS